MKSPRSIYLLRHGEISAGSRRCLIGQLDIPLSANGVQQAQWWANRWSNVPFARIVCSNLRRSRDTADILGNRLRCPIHVEPDLREISLGEWQGLTATEVRSRFPEEWEARGKDMEHYRPPGGESFRELAERVVPVFEGIAHGNEKTILLVGHAGVNRVILCHVLGLPLSNLLRLGQDYACATIIELSNEIWSIRVLNRRPDRF